MIEFKKPKIGLLGMMIEGYEPLFPGIIARQEAYARTLAESLSDIADVTFPGAATTRQQVEQTVADFNNQGLDGILIVLLAYSHSTWLMHALQKNQLPLALAVLQPDEVMQPTFVELDFTVNQGIHGAQDNANAIRRLDKPCVYFAGSRTGERFFEFFRNFSKAAAICTRFRNMRVATIGKMTGMGDLFADEIGLYTQIGPEYAHETIGSVSQIMPTISDEAIRERIEYEKTVFQIDESMTYEQHAHAVRQYLALRQFLESRDYQAFTLHFEVLGEDGRYDQLPFLAASALMSEGYGYAAEGDAMCATMLSAAMQMTDKMATFTEMYAMDFAERALLLCHAGESNWNIARKDKKPRLIDKIFNEGGLDNPPTPLFTPEPTPATIVSFAPMLGNKFKLVVCDGQIIDKEDLNGCEMPYMFFKPDCDMEYCVEKWLEHGGTHHEIVTVGKTSECWKMIAKFLGIELCII